MPVGAREVTRRSVACMRTRPSEKGLECSFEEGSRRWDSVMRRWRARSWARRVRESSGKVGVDDSALEVADLDV